MFFFTVFVPGFVNVDAGFSSNLFAKFVVCGSEHFGDGGDGFRQIDVRKAHSEDIAEEVSDC